VADAAAALRVADEEPRRGHRARWAWLAAVAVVLFLCFLRLSGTFPDNSDGADQALQAWDMLHGNWLLRGWTVGDVSYYTTEIPEYALVELFRGLGQDVVHIAGALTYTLLVLTVGLLARGGATGREGLVRALVAAGILLAPQFGNGVHMLLQQPDHIGTQVPLLLVFLMLDRAPRRWYVPTAVAVVLSWVMVADRVAVFDAVLPLVVVCGIRALRTVIRDREPLTSQWYELSLVAASGVSFVAATVAVRVIDSLHGYQVLPLVAKHAQVNTLPTHFVLTMEGILNTYGADFFHMSPGFPGGPASAGPALGSLPLAVGIALAAVHLVGVALALWGFVRAFRYFFAVSDLVSPVLAMGIVINVAAYVFSVVPVTLFDTREILAVLPFGAVLAGRMVAGELTKARLAPVLRPALAGVLACYLAALGYGAVQAPTADNEQQIIPWLEAHHLTSGLGTYTEANLITLDSGGRVAIRTVSWRSAGDAPRRFESNASWYDPRHGNANFVLTNSADSGGRDQAKVSLIPRSAIVALHAGPPAHVYHYKTFTIMVWNHNLLDNLGSNPVTSPGEVPCPGDCT
jgi:hypothetical protein